MEDTHLEAVVVMDRDMSSINWFRFNYGDVVEKNKLSVVHKKRVCVNLTIGNITRFVDLVVNHNQVEPLVLGMRALAQFNFTCGLAHDMVAFDVHGLNAEFYDNKGHSSFEKTLNGNPTIYSQPPIRYNDIKLKNILQINEHKIRAMEKKRTRTFENNNFRTSKIPVATRNNRVTSKIREI